MKIRSGFVSNSSTSSFICSICGTIEAGRDCCLEDFLMVECENGHVYHTDCVPESLRVDGFDEMHSDNDDDDDNGDDDNWNESVKATKCPLCRFEIIAEEDLIAYLKMQVNKSNDEIAAEIKSAFPDYQAFSAALKKWKDAQKTK